MRVNSPFTGSTGWACHLNCQWIINCVRRLVLEVYQDSSMSKFVFLLLINQQCILLKTVFYKDEGFKPSPSDFQPSPIDSPVFYLLAQAGHKEIKKQEDIEGYYNPFIITTEDGYLAKDKEASTPNYKCENSEETMFVKKVEVVMEDSCYTVHKMKCREEGMMVKVYYIQGEL